MTKQEVQFSFDSSVSLVILFTDGSIMPIH